VLGVDDRVAIWIRFVLGKACACEDRESNTKGLEIQECLLQSAITSAAKVPCAPVAGLLLSEEPVEDTLGKSLLPEGLLLLSEMGRDISYGRRNAKCLMECSLDGHAGEATTSTEATTVLLLSPLLM